MAKKRKKGWLWLALELFVVFIGVTAGFLFDNFREDQANRRLEQKYLESFYNNLRVDSSEIQSMILDSRNNLDISKRTVAAMQTGTLTEDSALITFSVMATYNNLNLEDATYESVVNSGNLGIIRDFDIQEKIVYYYGTHDDMRYVEEVYNDYITNYIVPFGSRNLDFITGEFIDQFSVNDIAFRNITSGYNVLVTQKMELVHTLDSLNKDLMKTLELKLN